MDGFWTCRSEQIDSNRPSQASPPPSTPRRPPPSAELSPSAIHLHPPPRPAEASNVSTAAVRSPPSPKPSVIHLTPDRPLWRLPTGNQEIYLSCTMLCVKYVSRTICTSPKLLKLLIQSCCTRWLNPPSQQTSTNDHSAQQHITVQLSRQPYSITHDGTVHYRVAQNSPEHTGQHSTVQHSIA